MAAFYLRFLFAVFLSFAARNDRSGIVGAGVSVRSHAMGLCNQRPVGRVCVCVCACVCVCVCVSTYVFVSLGALRVRTACVSCPASVGYTATQRPKHEGSEANGKWNPTRENC